MSMRVLKKAYQPDGFNLGMNHGAVAGAGIQSIYITIWFLAGKGDLNFFPLIAETKAVIENLEQSFDRLIGIFWRGINLCRGCKDFVESQLRSYVGWSLSTWLFGLFSTDHRENFSCFVYRASLLYDHPWLFMIGQFGNHGPICSCMRKSWPIFCSICWCCGFRVWTGGTLGFALIHIFYLSGFGAAIIYCLGVAVYAMTTGNAEPLMVPVVGASGAIFGIMLAYGVCLANVSCFSWDCFLWKPKFCGSVGGHWGFVHVGSRRSGRRSRQSCPFGWFGFRLDLAAWHLVLPAKTMEEKAKKKTSNLRLVVDNDSKTKQRRTTTLGIGIRACLPPGFAIKTADSK